MRSSYLISLAASAALAVPLVAVAPSVAEANPSKPALVERFHTADAPAPTSRDEAKEYAAAERNAPDTASFSGGSVVLIIGPTVLILLAILLILL